MNANIESYSDVDHDKYLMEYFMKEYPNYNLDKIVSLLYFADCISLKLRNKKFVRGDFVKKDNILSLNTLNT